MPVPESTIIVDFVYNRSVKTAFSEIIAFLDNAGPTYFQQSEQRLKIKGDLAISGLTLRPEGRYSYSAGLVTTSILCERVTSLEGGHERFDNTIAFLKEIYETTTPQYVFGMHSWRMERIEKAHLDHSIPSPISDESLRNHRIDYPTWLMLFPPAMVEEYGREWLLDLPVARIDELDSGAIMTVATVDFLDCESDTEIAQQINNAMEPLEEAFQARNE